MSLLLEALKKAELAKQAAKAQAPAGEKPAFTREHLPDISQAMEIRSEDLRLAETAPASNQEEKAAFELALEQAPQAVAEPTQTPSAETGFKTRDDYAEREQAQRIFAAKGLAGNPRKPFYLTLGALGLFALGAVGYFWLELHPGGAFTRPAPARTARPSSAHCSRRRLP